MITSNAIELEKVCLLTCQFLGLLANTLAADAKYTVFNRENLTTSIKVQLSKKETYFSDFFAAFLKCSLNLQHLEGKDDPHRFFYF